MKQFGFLISFIPNNILFSSAVLFTVYKYSASTIDNVINNFAFSVGALHLEAAPLTSRQTNAEQTKNIYPTEDKTNETMEVSQHTLQTPYEWFVNDARFDKTKHIVTYFCNYIFEGRERFMNALYTFSEYNDMIESMIHAIREDEVYFVVNSPSGLQAKPLEQYVDVCRIASPLFMELVCSEKPNNFEDHPDLLRVHLCEFTHAFTYRLPEKLRNSMMPTGPYFKGKLTEDSVGSGSSLRNSLRDSIVNKKGRACLVVVKTTREKNVFAAVKACLEACLPQ